MGNIEDKKNQQESLHPTFREAEFMAPDKLVLSPKPSNQFFEWVRKCQDFIQCSPQTCLLFPEYEEIII